MNRQESNLLKIARVTYAYAVAASIKHVAAKKILKDRALFIMGLVALVFNGVLVPPAEATPTLDTNSLGDGAVGHGTLVVMLPYKDGVLLMADKETRLEISGEVIEKRNDRVKLVQLGPAAAGFCTDQTLIAKPAGLDPDTGNLRFKILFDAPVELASYFEYHPAESIERGIIGLQQHLATKFSQAVSQLPVNPLIAMPPGSRFLQCGMVRFNAEAGIFEGFIVVLLKALDGQQAIQGGQAVFPAPTFKTAELQCFGRTEVFNSIKTGGTGVFEQDFKDKPLRTFIRSSPAADKLSFVQAMRYSASLILATHDYLVTEFPTGSVGETVDALSISPGGGVHWELHGVPARMLLLTKRKNNR